MDLRLKSLANASKVLLASDDLNPPQIFAGQAALLEVLVSCGQSALRPLYDVVLDELATTSHGPEKHEVSDSEEPTTTAVRLLWYHAGIHTALADLAPRQAITTSHRAAVSDEASAALALERLLSLLLLRGPERRKKHGVGDLAGEVTYRELNAALLRSTSEGIASGRASAGVPPETWVARLLNQLVAVATAPAINTTFAENNDHQGSSGFAPDSSDPIGDDETEDEVPRAAACRLISLILEHATAAPHSGVAAAVGKSLSSVEQQGGATNTYKNGKHSGESAFSVLERELRSCFGPNTTLATRAAHSKSKSNGGGGSSTSSNVRSSDETCAADRARRRTLMVELLPALFPPSLPPSSWVVDNVSPDGNSSGSSDNNNDGKDTCQTRLKDFWDRLSSAASLPLSLWAVQEVEDALGAACLLLDPRDLGTPELVGGVPWRHAIPGSSLWALVSRGLSLDNAPLARRRALHLLRAVANLSAHKGVLLGDALEKKNSDDDSRKVKPSPKKKGAAAVEARNERKKNTQNGSGHGHGTKSHNKSGTGEGKVLTGEEMAAARAAEWLSFCDAFDLYEHEFQPHLIAQVAPVVRRLGLSAAKHDAAICQDIEASEASKLATAATGADAAPSETSYAERIATVETPPGTATTAGAKTNTATNGSMAPQQTPFWEGLLPPMSFAWVRKLVAASLRVDHPQAVKHGLLLLLRGGVLPLPPQPPPQGDMRFPPSSGKQLSSADSPATSKHPHSPHVDPARALPPRWLCTVLLRVLDDTKLYRDHTPDDEVGSAVRAFFTRYLSAPGLHPRQGRASLVRRVAAALAGTPGKLELPGGGWNPPGDTSGKCESMKQGETSMNAEATNRIGSKDNNDDDDDEEEDRIEEDDFDETIGPQPAMWCHFAILHVLGAFEAPIHAGATAVGPPDGTVDLPGGIGPSLLEALCNRCLGADRFGCLNLAMRGLVVQALVPLVCRGTDLRRLRESTSKRAGGSGQRRGRGEEMESPLLRVPAKFLALLPRAALRCESPPSTSGKKSTLVSSSAVDTSALVPGQASLLAPWAAALACVPNANSNSSSSSTGLGVLATTSLPPCAAEKAVRAALAAGGQWDVSLEGLARLIALLAFHDLELNSDAVDNECSSSSRRRCYEEGSAWVAALAPAMNQLERAYAAPGLRPWPQTRAAASLLAVSAAAAASLNSARVLHAFRGLLLGGDTSSSSSSGGGGEGGGLRACRLLAERLQMHLSDLMEMAAGRSRTPGTITYGDGWSSELDAAIEAEAEEAAEDAQACSVALATLLRALFASPQSMSAAASGAGTDGVNESENCLEENRDKDYYAFPAARAVASSLVCDLTLAAGAALAELLPAQLSASSQSLLERSTGAEVQTAASSTARARLAALAATTLRGLMDADRRLFTESSLWTNAAEATSLPLPYMATPAKDPTSSSSSKATSFSTERLRLSPAEVVAALSPSAPTLGRSANEPSAPQALLSLLVHCDLGPLPAAARSSSMTSSSGGSDSAGTAAVTTAAAGRAWSEFGVARWGAVAALALMAPQEAASVLGAAPTSMSTSPRSKNGAAAVSTTNDEGEAPGDVLVALLAAAGHEAIIAKGEAREAAAAVARACHAIRPVLGALLQRPTNLSAERQPVSRLSAAAAPAARASRRAWYEAVSNAAWEAFVESGSYRPSTADAVASLLFQPAFFGDEALTGSHLQWQNKSERAGTDKRHQKDEAARKDNDCDEEEDDVTNLLALALAKFEALALRGKPHVLRAAVGRCCLGWRQHPRSGGAFVEVLARLLGTKEPALRLQELPSEGGWLVEGCLLKQHGAPKGGSSSSSSSSSAVESEAVYTAPSSDEDGRGQGEEQIEESDAIRTPLSEAWSRVMVLLMFEGIVHDMKLHKSKTSSPSSNVAWAGALCLRLLDAMLDTATLTVNPMINTDAYGQRLRSAQALCVLAPLLASATLQVNDEEDQGGEGCGDCGHEAGRDFISEVHDRVWQVLQQPVLHVVRFYLDLFTSQIYEASPWHPKAMASLQGELNRASVSAQTLGSLMLVAMHAANFHAKALVTLRQQEEEEDDGGNASAASAPAGTAGTTAGSAAQESTSSPTSSVSIDKNETFKKHRAALGSLLSVVAPYVGAASAFARTLAQLLVHQVVPLLSEHRPLDGGQQHDNGDGNDPNDGEEKREGHLKLLWRYLDGNKDMVKARWKQKRLLARFDVLQECSVKTMLQHGDNFNEISPVTVVDLVAAALRELYEESFVEENLVTGPNSGSKMTTATTSTSTHLPSSPPPSPQARLPPSPDSTHQSAGQASATAEVALSSGAATGATSVADGANEIDCSSSGSSSGNSRDNVQRKIQVWWEGLELGASDALAGRQLNGKGAPRQSGLVVCATLVDKTPNVAGLTRTCEIFGASSLVIPNLGIVQSDTFKQISVTAEGWLPLEEVRPCDLLPWLQRKKREGFTVVGLEQTARSVPLAGLGSKALPARTVLLLGKEKEGIPVEYLREVDICVEIPQLGVVRSLNVHVSGAIAIWEFTRQQHLREMHHASANAAKFDTSAAASSADNSGADAGNDFGSMGATSLRRRLPGLPKP